MTIAENLRVGNIVLNVVANDTDAGINGLLRYSIAAPTSGGADLFVIQENTGTVLSSGTFDRETFAGPYTFEVCLHGPLLYILFTDFTYMFKLHL